MRVRVATLDDVDTIVRLNAVVQELHHRQLPDRFKTPDPAGFAPIVRAWLSEEDMTLFVAELEGGRPVGYALAVRRQRSENVLTRGLAVVELDQIVVEPTARRQGVGEALAREVIDHARRLGAAAVELSVHAFNEDAHEFFTAIGFRNVMVRMSVGLHDSGP